MDEKLKQFKAQLAEISDLMNAAAVLEWDMQTYMPPGGGEARAEQIATLQKLGHEKFTHADTGQQLEALQPELQRLAPDSDDASLIRVATRDYERARKVPTELVAEIARTTSMAHEVWAKARAEKNFSAFLPMLEKIIELKHRVADCFGPQDSPYDPLLDEYEPGMKTAQVRAVFAELKSELVPLVKAIAAKPKVDDSVLHKDYEEQKQWEFGEMVIKRFGYDFTHGRQDKSVHPFTTSFSPGDVRITTRLMRNFIPSALMGTLHECGHALYEQGVAPELGRTLLASGTSLGIHESQSRMWENLVGRSRGFWKFFYPQLQEVFPENLRGVDLDVFYKALNKVETSFIRVEADEVTYNLHTLLRFELEVDLMEDRLKAKDLPAAWNAKVKEYLGLDVPDDSQGVLQDVHWSAGYIGYFPTYTLGNILSVQFFEKAIQAVPSIPTDIERGEFGGLLGWLRENIHRHGRKYTPNELIQRVTGEPLNAKPYLGYLKRKYQELYGIKDEELRG
jgi:carboxypeptidase Taq